MFSEKFSNCKSMETLDPVAWAVWTLGASLAGFMKGTTRYC